MWYEHDYCGHYVSARLPSTTLPEGPIGSVVDTVAVKKSALLNVWSRRANRSALFECSVQHDVGHERVSFNNENSNRRLFTLVGDLLDQRHDFRRNR